MKATRECKLCMKASTNISSYGMCEDCIAKDVDIEESISKHIISAWNEFLTLTQTHPSDIQDFNEAIHDLQKVIGMRELRRLMPEKYPIKKSMESSGECI